LLLSLGYLKFMFHKVV